IPAPTPPSDTDSGKVTADAAPAPSAAPPAVAKAQISAPAAPSAAASVAAPSSSPPVSVQADPEASDIPAWEEVPDQPARQAGPTGRTAPVQAPTAVGQAEDDGFETMQPADAADDARFEPVDMGAPEYDGPPDDFQAASFV